MRLVGSTTMVESDERQLPSPGAAKTSRAWKWFETFRRAQFEVDEYEAQTSHLSNNTYNGHRAALRTANTALARRLKSRHLQMIAIGGSIGTGLWIGTGKVMAVGGPGSVLFAFMAIGIVLYFTMQAMGELAALFPVAGSFAAFGTRFIDPAWGFAMGWNYALQWLVVMPLELIAAVRVLSYWKSTFQIPEAWSITVFLGAVLSVNLCGVRAFGEAEFMASVIKAAAVVGFILLGIVIDVAGNQHSGYIGIEYWINPGAFLNGIKGFCSVLVTASFAFAGTELVGLAAAETLNPTKAIPTACKQAFWRIFLYFIVSIFVVGLIVRSDNPRLTGNEGDPSTSPFVIAIEDAGIRGLNSVMNVVILISIMSVANSSFFGSSRVLAALAEQKQAPSILRYIDRKGRPLVAVAISAGFGLLAYMGTGVSAEEILNWLIALSGLSSIFTWGSICFAHIRFRKAWALKGHSLDELAYRSPVGVWGSWAALSAFSAILVLQFWVAIDPIQVDSDHVSRLKSFFSTYLAAPVVLVCYVSFKVGYKTEWVPIDKIDVDTGRYQARRHGGYHPWRDDAPFLKKVFTMFF